MTSASLRPSYLEAQERLIKWCQNVTRNYEVYNIDKTTLYNDFHIVCLVSKNTKFY